jgi:hypothetical protein
MPLSPSPGSLQNLRPDDPAAIASKSGALAVWTAGVGPDYFETMGIPVREGRAFRLADDTLAAAVAVVNDRAAELLWPGRSPLGRRFRLSAEGPQVTVVGVVRTGRYVVIGEVPKPYVYLPFAQAFQPFAFLTIRGDRDPAAIERAIRPAFAAADPNLIPSGVETLRHLVDTGFQGIMLLRLAAIIASGIGLMAVILTIVGLYGVIAYSVAQRTQEIGVRIALGAAPSRVIGSVVGHGARLAGAGIVIGLGAAFAVTRVAAGMLVQVGTTDLVVFGSVVGALVAITLGASFLPARRAARLDPVRALRAD